MLGVSMPYCGRACRSRHRKMMAGLCGLLLLCCLSLSSVEAREAQNNRFTEAMELASKGDYQRARDIMQELLEENDQLHRVRLELALVYSKLGKIEQAKKHLNRVLSVGNLPPNVAANIRALLQRLSREERKLRQRGGHRLGVVIEFASGVDSNVRFGSDENIYGGSASSMGGPLYGEVFAYGDISEFGLWDEEFGAFEAGDFEIWIDPGFDEAWSEEFYELDDLGEYGDYEEFYFALDEFNPDFDDEEGFPEDTILVTEEGIFTEDGDFIPFEDELFYSKPDTSNRFNEFSLLLNHHYTPDSEDFGSGRLRWNNQLSLNAVKQGELGAYDQQNLRLSSSLVWLFNDNLRARAGVWIKQVDRNQRNIVDYRAMDFKLSWLGEAGVFDVRLDHLEKDYDDAFYYGYDADYSSLSLGWSNFLIEDTLLVSVQAKAASNSRQALPDFEEFLFFDSVSYDSRAFSTSFLYLYDDDWELQASLSAIRFDYDNGLEEDYRRLSARLAYNMTENWQAFVSGKLEIRDVSGGFPRDDRELLKVGVRWTFQ